MQQPFDDLNELWDQAWSQLLRAQRDGKHPYALPVFATSSPTPHPFGKLRDRPRSRTLVLRKADKELGELRCYTDTRSRKATDLATSDGVASWTFWNPRSRIQVNASGPTAWLDREDARKLFDSLPKHSRKSYATELPPGTELRAPGDGLPTEWTDKTLRETDFAFANFGVIVTKLTEVDILQLHREGHRRMRATRMAGQEWGFSWLVP